MTDTHYTLAHALLWGPLPCRSSEVLASRAGRCEGLVVPSLDAWKQLMKRVGIIIFLIPLVCSFMPDFIQSFK